MPGKLRTAIAHWAANFFQFRDDLRLRNIRWELWPLLLVFPLSVIKGDLRYFGLKAAIAGYQSWELVLLPLGLGWLVLACTSKRLILPMLRGAVVLSAVLLPLGLFMPDGLYRLEMFLAFQFLNGICAAAAFCLFCFELNNIERLLGMVIIQFYYGSFYILWLAFPAAQAAGETWGGAVAIAACLVVVFASPRPSFSEKHEGLEDPAKMVPGTAAFAIGLHVVYYMIICVINRIRWTENSLSSTAFGIGAFASIVLILVIQVLNNRSALYVWLLFLVLTVAGLGVLMYETPVTRLSGSFAYGLGDALGYTTIYYLCASSIKKSKPLKMWRLCCLVFFVEYSCISGGAAYVFSRPQLVGRLLPDYPIAFGIVLVLCLACFLLMPLMQKKLFEKDWTDGIQLQDIAEYAPLLAETDAIIANAVGATKDHLDLTDREHEVFTLLLKNVSPKEIAGTLKISYNTVVFHRQNLYRKLGIQSRAELLTLYLPMGTDSKDRTGI
jgi:DNA-binding CsgD family transcriptional regulator